MSKPDEPVIHIKPQNRKTLSMRVNLAGEVIVAIPNWMKPTHPQVKKFIKQGLQKLDKHMPDEKPDPEHTQASIRRMVTTWAKRMGVKPTRVQFRQMTRKWGSCSSRGSITLNEMLCYLPHRLVEYVVVHELAHLTELNHDPAFWALLGSYLPEYAALEDELNAYHV